MLLISISFTTCKFPEKSGKNKVTNYEKEEGKVAAFLVKSTEINLRIIYLCTAIESNSNSVKIKDVIQNQKKLTLEIHTDIKNLAEKNLVNLPIIDNINKVEYTNDMDVINSLTNELTEEITQFEKISENTNDTEIYRLKSEFLPKLTYQAEQINSLKINI